MYEFLYIHFYSVKGYNYQKKFLKNFYLCVMGFTMLGWFLPYSEVNQLHVYIYPLFFGFPAHLGHHRALSGVPRAIQ